jgi:hypothetical protein
MDPVTGVKTGLALYEVWQKLTEQRLKIGRRLARKRFAIAIFGAGGVGKSTLGHFLDEKFDPRTTPKPYLPSPDTEEYYLKSNPSQSIFVAPGQEGRSGGMGKLLGDLAQTKRLVIINIVAYGYHAPDVEYKGHIENYFEANRKMEIEKWQELTGMLTVPSASIKLITAVVKEDLWYPNASAVKAYYEEGEYAQILQQLRSRRGEMHCPHEFVYVSLTSHNLTDTSGRILATIVAGYDDVPRRNAQARLMDILERFTKNER